MKRKSMEIMAVTLSLFVLAACGNTNLAQPTVSKATRDYQKTAPKSSASTQRVKQKTASEQETIQAFLNAYTTYSSLNAQKNQMKPFLTSDLQRSWAVDQSVSPSLNQVTSVGEMVSLVQHSAHHWFAIVKVTINEQSQHSAVFDIQTVQNKSQFQISNCRDLNQE